MKRNLLSAAILLLVLGLAGCATSARNSSAPVQYRPRAFALAVSVSGGLQPTPQQWATIQAKVAESLAIHGWVLVSDLALADSILRVDFIPGVDDPENTGVVRVIAIRDNPRVSIASTTSVGRYPTSFGYLGSFQNASWGYNSYSNNHYYGWGNSYYDGFSYGSANLNPTNPPLAPPAKPINPPHRQHPDRRNDCPPLVDHYIRPRPHRPSDGDALPMPGRESPGRGDHARWVGSSDQSQPSRSYTRSGFASSSNEGATGRSESSSSVPARTYSRAEPSPSQLNRSSTRSSSSDTARSDRTYSRSDPTSSRSERTSTSSDSTTSRPERTYSSNDSSRSWQGRSESSAARSDSTSRPERTYSRSESSDSSRSERSYSRSESSSSRSESSHSSPTRDYSPPSPPPSSSSSDAGSSNSTSTSPGVSTDPAR